jgi:GNAT superfamily N-acetyltransferase
MSVVIRQAEAGDVDALSRLAWRSKAHWGYDDGFMTLAQGLLKLTPTTVMLQPTFLAEVDGVLAGFYALRPWRDLPEVAQAAELDYLFIDPPFIGHGVGRALFEHAVGVARAMGYHTLVIISDPNAEGFYQRMGAVTFGQSKSDIGEERWLPVMQLALRTPA